MKHIKLFEQFINESLNSTFADFKAEEEGIDNALAIKNDFAKLKKYTKYVGANKPSDLYLAGSTIEGNEDEFVPTGKEERIKLMIWSEAPAGSDVMMGTFQGEPAFSIDSNMPYSSDQFIFVGPKSKNKIK